MDRDFLRKYYTIRYEDPVKTASDGDGEYAYALEKYACRERRLLKKAGGMESEIWQLYEDCINARMEAELVLNRDFYLLGAADYEEMKRIKRWCAMVSSCFGGFLGVAVGELIKKYFKEFSL